MPANLTPDYYKAEKWFKSATTTEEKILALEEMLAVIPKHKGTDHMRADLRKKLSKLKEVPVKKGGAKHVDIFYIPKSGAGLVVLIGTPNCGKSSIVGLLTNAKVNIADFPYATNAPVPGMFKFEDIQIELVDMPPITAEYSAPGQVGAYRNCDLIAIVIDLSSDIQEQLDVSLDFLDSRRLLINETTDTEDKQGNKLGKKAFCIGTKCDLAPDDAFEKLKLLCDRNFEFVKLSTKTLHGTEALAKDLFKLLNIIGVYTKKPGKKADMTDPFTLPAGSTIYDLARAIHRELAEKLKYARIWGTGVHPGQNVQRTHILCDKDVIELHFS